MTDPSQTADAREAEDMGEKPDLGRTPDALTEALSGRARSARSRSTAVGSANCAPGSPSTKYPRRMRPLSSIAFSIG